MNCFERKESKARKCRKNNRPASQYSRRKITDDFATSAPAHTNCPCDGHCPRCITKARYETKKAKVDCDVKIHPDDFMMYQLGQDARTQGEGIPKMKMLDESLETKYPCLYKAVIAHEGQHITNSEVNCKNFKKCVDEKSSPPWGKDEPEISREDFNNCSNTHHGGATSNCVTDEKSAYEAGLIELGKLSVLPECAAEKTVLQDAIKQWTKYKNKPPNCP